MEAFLSDLPNGIDTRKHPLPPDPTILAKQDEKQQQKKEAKIRRQALDLGYKLVPLQGAVN